MQTIYKDEDEESGSRRTDRVGTIICARRVSKHLEGEHLGRFGKRRIGIQICGRVFGSYQERVWRRGVGKSGKIEKIRARRKDNGRMSRLKKVDLVSFYFFSIFIFLVDLFFIFSIFRTPGLEVTSHISHI